MNFFLYDGKCPFCSKTAKQLQTICLSSEIEFHSFRELTFDKLKLIHPNLTEEILVANVQFIYKGIRYPGFFGIRKLVIYLKFYRYFFWILYLPLIPLVGILIMNFLKHRTGHDS